MLMHYFGVVQATANLLNLLEPQHHSPRCGEFFGVVRLYRTFSSYLYRGNKVCRVLKHSFGVVKARQTSSNLLEPPHHRSSQVWSILFQEFGVVRLYRTFSSYFVTGETRCAGCFCTRSKHPILPTLHIVLSL